MRPYLLVLGLIVLLAGCAGRHLAPAPQADRVAGDENAAQDEQNGVRVIFEADWHGDPDNLESAVTPLRVSLTNDSGHPLRVRYRDFTLATDTGFRSRAMPPFQIRGSVPEVQATLVRPYYGWNGFYVAPYFSPFYGPYYRPWAGPWAFDAPYYTFYTTWQKPLPTEDMLERALPEGVLERGGTLTGYIYFQRIPEGVKGVQFQAKLIDAVTEETVATMAIPFVVKR